MRAGRAETLGEAVSLSPSGRRRSWPRRAARRLGVLLLVLALVLTAFSLGFNRLTDGRTPPPDRLRYVEAGDVPTRIRAWGDAGSPVVLVHGAAESADTWDAVAQRLATAGHLVYALDLDGWGYTRRIGPFDLDHQTRQLLALLTVLRLDRPVLVGHSSGAAVIAEAALRSPASIGGLLLLDGDALATGPGERSPVRFIVLPPFRTTLLRLAVGSDALIRSVYSRQCGPRCPALDAAGLDAWRRPFQVPGAEAGLWGMLAAGVPGLSEVRLSGLAALPMPKAVVFGAQDSVFSADSAAQTAARIGAPTPTLIPQARHLTLISDPGPVADAVQALCARASA